MTGTRSSANRFGVETMEVMAFHANGEGPTTCACQCALRLRGARAAEEAIGYGAFAVMRASVRWRTHRDYTAQKNANLAQPRRKEWRPAAASD